MTEALERPTDGPSDAALIGAVRRGDTSAYGLLYRRHLGAARRASTCLAATAVEREDLVAEAFTRVLRVLRTGRGPTEEFRPYLLVTMRNAAINTTRRGPWMSLYADLPDAYLRPAGDDPFSARLHVDVAATAFASLPERWRMVLWHTEIEGETPADIAPMLGMSPNSVAALAYRAREGLRQAYLQAHLPSVDRRDCRATVDKLAGWVRRNTSPVTMRRITMHLDRCPRCRELATGLVKINDELRGVLAPIVLGTPFAVAYLQASALSSATSASALAAASASASAATGVSGATASAVSAVKTAVLAAACKVGAVAAIAASTAITVVASQPAHPPEDGTAPVAAPGPNRGIKPAAAPPRSQATTPAAAAPAEPVPAAKPAPPAKKAPEEAKKKGDPARTPKPPRAGGQPAAAGPPATGGRHRKPEPAAAEVSRPSDSPNPGAAFASSSGDLAAPERGSRGPRR